MTTPAYRTDQVTVYHGDCLTVLPELAECSVDSVVTDPPYGLEFMGKDWDAPWKGSASAHAEARVRRASELDDPSKGKFIRAGVNAYEAGKPFQSWCTAWATECLRVLKPGGHLLAFGGTRTHHRLACAVEDAGFEIRDSIAWLYGSGFPKSLDVSKAIDKAAGAEREQIAVAKGARNGNGQNVDYGDYGSAADGTYALSAPATDAAKQWQGWGTALKPAHEPIVVARKPITGTVAANVQTHGTGALNINACRIEAGQDYRDKCASVVGLDSNRNGAAYNEWTGVRENSANQAGRWPTNVVIDEHTAQGIDQQSGHSVSPPTGNIIRPKGRKSDSMAGPMAGDRDLMNGYGDEGGASRFFPTFKYHPKAPTLERPTHDGTAHPTVKPLDLMRWLICLVTPPHGTVLDPFAGSGTTAEAAIHEHMRAIVIEREADYLPVLTNRLHKPMQIGFDYDQEELPF